MSEVLQDVRNKRYKAIILFLRLFGNDSASLFIQRAIVIPWHILIMEDSFTIRRRSGSGSEIGVQTASKDVSNHNTSRVLDPMTIEEDAEEAPEPAAKKSLAFKLAFIGLAATGFVFQVDATALGIALPTIAEELSGDNLGSFWANMSYTLCGLVMQPLWASISDAFGRKPPLYACMSFFFVGSIVFATAKTMNTVIIGRVLQGFGGGGIDVLAQIILADMTTLKERSTYLGLMAIPNAVGNILGPVIGASFSNYLTWRWIGWINLPLLGFAAPLVIFFLKLRPVRLDSSLVENLNNLDWIGMALVVVGITVFVLPLSWAGSLFPWGSWQTLLPMLLGLVLLVTFAIYEAKPKAPIVPHRLFRSKTANMTLAGAFIHGMILVALLQYLPLFYQAVGLQTAIQSAVSLMPTVITSVVFAAASMMMVSVIGGYVWILRFAWVVLTVGTGLLALFNADSSSSMRLGVPILWGTGVALLRLNMLPMQASVKGVDDTGAAIGLLMTIRMFGGLIGLTIASTIFNSVFSNSISSTAGQLTGPLAPLSDASNAVAFILELRVVDISTEALRRILGVYLTSFRAIFFAMTAFSGLGLVTSMFVDEIDLSKKNLGRQRFEE
ncbi:MFS general substrate transporter [Glarea lozoyensis ATCC 20868]|uniref:MFS general substrate transporter n=1 Tax=Glarea lozoyensis (strain ATCC 20868 / MF5171) TaxID=1116229 RepID=S3CE14_GLAL2|nr:MFS general substrate transporter [Glarea lozoyensis ATCC 20868]EPE24250.1 MFS general substrate transporter [Glarea lozoyensis ATCC 20868]